MQAMAELEPTGAISSRAIRKWLIAGAKPLGAGADVSGAEPPLLTQFGNPCQSLEICGLDLVGVIW